MALEKGGKNKMVDGEDTGEGILEVIKSLIFSVILFTLVVKDLTIELLRIVSFIKL